MKSLLKDSTNIFTIIFAVLFFTQIAYADSDKDALKLHEEGMTYLKARQYDKAIKAFKGSIRLNPDSKVAYGNWIVLGLLYRKLGQLNKAIESFIEGLRLIPISENVHLLLAENYLLQGQYEKAIKSFKEAINLKPDYADAHRGLGMAYLFQNQDSLAADHYYKAGLLHLEQDNRKGALAAYDGIKVLSNKELERKLFKKLYPEK